MIRSSTISVVVFYYPIFRESRVYCSSTPAWFESGYWSTRRGYQLRNCPIYDEGRPRQKAISSVSYTPTLNRDGSSLDISSDATILDLGIQIPSC